MFTNLKNYKDDALSKKVTLCKTLN